MNESRNGSGMYSRDRSRPQHQLHRQGDSKTRARDTALAAVPPNRRRRRTGPNQRRGFRARQTAPSPRRGGFAIGALALSAGLRSQVILGLQVKRLVWTRTGQFIRSHVNAVGLSTFVIELRMERSTFVLARKGFADTCPSANVVLYCR